jgi:predicted acylesterase/phospholipase RssA
LAAVAALQSAESDKIIEVTRVSGASAGALAAAVYASGIPAALVRKRLQALGDSRLAQLFPERSTWTQLSRIGFGIPLYGTDRLRKLLLDLLAADPDELEVDDSKPPEQRAAQILAGTTFAALGKPCFVTVTSLSAAKGQSRGGPNDQTPVIDSLVDSSALPFVFRTAAHMDQNPTLDGGLCENLPTHDLLVGGGREEFGEIIAISFDRSDLSVPKNPLKFALTLFDLMINHAVQRSIASLPKDSVCRVPTKLKTLDFAQMCAGGLDDLPYKGAYKYVAEWIRKWASSGVDRIRAPALGIEDFLTGVGKVAASLAGTYRIERSALVVVLRAFVDGSGEVEDVYSVTDLEPIGDPLRAYTSFLGSSDGTPGEAQWTVWPLHDGKPTGARCEHVLLPVTDTAKKDPPKKAPAVALFFAPALQPATHYRIETKATARNSLKELRERRGDFLENELYRSDVTARFTDIVLAVPRGFGVKGTPNRGRVLTETEIAHDGYSVHVPPGFEAFGWRAEGVTQGKGLRVELERT